MPAEMPTPEEPFSTTIARYYRLTHTRVLQLVDDLSEEQIAWRPTPGGPSIGFTLWHLARWADHLQATLPGMTPELGQRLGLGRQLWDAEGLAVRWNFAGESLGYAETGMHMDDAAAMRLPLPPKDVLLDYVQRAFAAAERAVSAIDDQDFLELERRQYADQEVMGEVGTVGDAVLTHVTHENRHLGMIECLRGLQGLHGTATS